MGRKVIVVGGGASGLTAAIFAARSGAEVTVLEGTERFGKKLLLTGNGRCNLTNMDSNLSQKYYGSGAQLACSLTQSFSAFAALGFFESIGLLTQDKNDYVYPYSAQAGSVLSALLTELSRLHVKLKTGEKITSVQKKDGIWQVKTEGWCYTADALILACGSKAAPSTGSDGSGYALAASLGHTIVTPAPALAPVVCKGSLFAPLAGVRCRAQVSLFQKQGEEPMLLKQDTGELQWTKYGVSGIVVFQLSRFISSSQKKGPMHLEIDLLPDFEDEYLTMLLCNRAALISKERASVLLDGLLHEKLIPVILKKAGLNVKTQCKEMTETRIRALVAAAKGLRLDVEKTKSFDVCQVCAGGVDCSEVSQELQSLRHENLYFAGEILDVDGPCGGYNLQWAWASGYTAGMAAAMEKKNDNQNQ
jgi:hypothetical protein